jgi:hypothetical protein
MGFAHHGLAGVQYTHFIDTKYSLLYAQVIVHFFSWLGDSYMHSIFLQLIPDDDTNNQRTVAEE